MVSGCTTPSTAPAHEIVDQPREGRWEGRGRGAIHFGQYDETQLKRKIHKCVQVCPHVQDDKIRASVSLAGVRKHPDREGLEGVYNFSRRRAAK